MVQRLLEGAGFVDVPWERLDRTGTSSSAAEAAIGLIEGNPVYLAIMQRRPEALADIKATVTRNVAAAFGDHPVRCPLRAIFFSARRPAA